MFGVTTPAVTTGRERLEELGYEVLVFHQTGAGGGSMEALIEAGFITGSLDVTEELMPEPLSEARPFDQPGDIRDDQLARLAVKRPEHRLQSGKRVRRDFGVRPGDTAEQR